MLRGGRGFEDWCVSWTRSFLKLYSHDKLIFLNNRLAKINRMKLPPLDSLRFFEVTARRLSVRVAAQELNVTAGAVSQQIRKLESHLGRSLFDRLPRGLALTSAGYEYYTACQEALVLIARATDKAKSDAQRVVLVSCTPSFASHWLVPRLQDFMRLQPKIEVHVSTTNRMVDMLSEGVQFAVRHGHGTYPGLQSEVLVDDDLVAVCSPRLIAPRRVPTAKDVEAATLLHDEHRGDWRLWLESTGMDPFQAERGVVLVDSNAAIESALAGNGVALVRHALARREVDARRLVIVKAPPIRTRIAYHLVYRREVMDEPQLRSFRDWVVTTAGD